MKILTGLKNKRFGNETGAILPTKFLGVNPRQRDIELKMLEQVKNGKH
jgi:hypothetical protein